jgi:hypothetical protein
MLDQASEAFALASEWLGDEQMRADAKAAVTKAASLIEKASAAVDRYTELADQIEANADALLAELVELSDEAAATLGDVRRLSRLAREGEGTIGQALNNPDLYNSLNDAATRLEQTLREVQLLIQKIKAEGVQVDL